MLSSHIIRDYLRAKKVIDVNAIDVLFHFYQKGKEQKQKYHEVHTSWCITSYTCTMLSESDSS